MRVCALLFVCLPLNVCEGEWTCFSVCEGVRALFSLCVWGFSLCTCQDAGRCCMPTTSATETTVKKPVQVVCRYDPCRLSLAKSQTQ